MESLTQEQLESLISRHLDGDLTDEEQALFYRHVLKDRKARRLFDTYEKIDRLSRSSMQHAVADRTTSGASSDRSGAMGRLTPRDDVNPDDGERAHLQRTNVGSGPSVTPSTDPSYWRQHARSGSWSGKLRRAAPAAAVACVALSLVWAGGVFDSFLGGSPANQRPFSDDGNQPIVIVNPQDDADPDGIEGLPSKRYRDRLLGPGTGAGDVRNVANHKSVTFRVLSDGRIRVMPDAPKLDLLRPPGSNRLASAGSSSEPQESGSGATDAVEFASEASLREQAPKLHARFQRALRSQQPPSE